MNEAEQHIHSRTGKPIGKPSGLARHAAETLARNYKLTPATLYSKIDPKWIPKPFLLYASLKIAQCIARPNGRLIISWPPRHGKSRLATIATPIWCLERFPDRNIILSTYGSDLSTDFGREVRDTFESNQHLLNERIRRDVKSVNRFKTTMGGGMLNVGLGGPIIGKGADVFLIDDYIKTMAEAQSETKHDSDWEWFTGTAYHRLEPGASMIIIATRWVKNDLIGHILRDFPGEWEHIMFPALAEEDDPLGRQVGEALFPERYDEEALADKKRVMGTFFFNALYQQKPEDDNAKLTNRDWINVVNTIPYANRLKFARIWDFGGGKGKENDPTVGTLMCADPLTRRCTILDVWRHRASPQTVESVVLAKAMADGTDTEIVIEQEPGASGIQLLTHYEENVLADFKVSGSKATTSKVVRANPFLAAAESGKVDVLSREWVETWLREYDDFPDGEHDDQVDTAAIGYNHLLQHKSLSATWGRGSDAQAQAKTAAIKRPIPDLDGVAIDPETGRLINTEITPPEDPPNKKAGFYVKGATWGSRNRNT